jgi:O-succinylbenzoic acid--CoA ligase
MVFAGYYGDPAATERALSSGWLNTGDIGYLDDEGDLHIVSRRSDLIVTGGENVYPAEVEGVIRRHIAVKDAAIVGIDDAEWGQRVAAAVVLVDGSHTTEADLIAYCREHLAGYKLPRVIRFVESLPQTTSGKIQRAAVRELFAAT